MYMKLVINLSAELFYTYQYVIVRDSCFGCVVIILLCVFWYTINPHLDHNPHANSSTEITVYYVSDSKCLQNLWSNSEQFRMVFKTSACDCMTQRKNRCQSIFQLHNYAWRSALTLHFTCMHTDFSV